MKKILNFCTLVLLLIGALNWGLLGFANFDFVAWLFGGDANWKSRSIYALIGLAGLWGLSFFGRCRAICCGCSHRRKKCD